MHIPDLDLLREELSTTGQAGWTDSLLEAVTRMTAAHGDLPRWERSLADLPRLPAGATGLDRPAITVHGEPIDRETERLIRKPLLALAPWRKGPFEIHGVTVDAEWRSDRKWDRVAPHLSDLTDRRVLDVGCGNGYYALRMLGRGARWVLGVDPTPLFCIQYRAFRHFVGPMHFWLLPVALEALPEPTRGVDTVFSMGVLYHRRSPFGHLTRLRRWLRPGGELVLETLVIDGGSREVLVPSDRYARMRNVWFLPSVQALLGWMERAGFADARCVDITATTTEEQRSTAWMPLESLDCALDPEDPTRTIEGYPGPKRAILIAKNP